MRLTLSCASIVRGPELLGSISRRSIGVNLFESLKNNAKLQNPALIDVSSDKTISYQSLLSDTCKTGSALRELTIGKNDIVSVCSENSLDFFKPVIAAFYEGVPTATINHSYSEGELLHVLKIIKPKAAFCSVATHEKFFKLQKNGDIPFVKQLYVMEELSSLNSNDGSYHPQDVDNAEKETALILFSSGTTGLPKGVMISHHNLNARFNQATDHRQTLSYIDEGIIVVPFYHALGFMTGIALIQKGKTLRFLPKFNERDYLKGIQDHKIKYLITVPPLVVLMAKSPVVDEYDLSSVEELICGAAPLSAELEEAVRKRLPNLKRVTQAYGQTELCLTLLSYGTQDAVKPGSSGKVIAGHEAIIRDPETGVHLDANKVGEICGKGPVVMQGYYNNEQATKDTFTDDGWLRTGDLGYYDNEGYFYIVDRLKELIKYKGFQVAPAELEALLLQNANIADAAVVGLPDERCGELPVAFVVKSATSNITEEKVKEFIEKQVSRAKRLHFVYFVESIPKTASGKILRRELKVLLNKHTGK